MNRSASILKFSLAEITGVTIQSHSQLSAAFCLRELDMDVTTVDSFLEELRRPLGTQTRFDRMSPLTKFVHQALFARPVRVGRRRWRWRVLRHFLHFLPEAERPHIRPYLFDVGQA